jgi:hypothetical protein
MFSRNVDETSTPTMTESGSLQKVCKNDILETEAGWVPGQVWTI